MRHLLPLLGCLAALGGTSARACSGTDLAALIKALGETDPEHQTDLAAHGLRLACPTWAPPVVAALGGMISAPPQMRPMLEAKSVAEAPAVWMAACPGGLDVVMQAARLPASEKRGHLFDACKAARHGFASRAEFVAGTGALFLPISAAHLLEREQVALGDRRLILRALAGVMGPAERARAKAVRTRERLRMPRMRYIRPFGAPAEPEPDPDIADEAVPFDPSAQFGAAAGLLLVDATPGPGCLPNRVEAMREHFSASARACRAGLEQPTVPLALTLTSDPRGAITAMQLTEGTLGALGFATCFEKRVRVARLTPAPQGCTLTIRAKRPQ